MFGRHSDHPLTHCQRTYRAAAQQPAAAQQLAAAQQPAGGDVQRAGKSVCLTNFHVSC